MKRKSVKSKRKIVKGDLDVSRKVKIRTYFFIFFGLLLILIGFLVFSQNLFEITGNSIIETITGIKNFFGISSLSASTFVSRSFLSQVYAPEVPLVVKLSITIDSNDKIINYGIEEYVPAGWSITNVNSTDYYSFNSGKISWIVNSSSNVNYLTSKDLYYTVIPSVSDSGSKVFTSNIIFTSVSSLNPVSESSNIQGTSSISNTAGSSTPSSTPSGGGSKNPSGGSSSNVPTITNSTSNASVINDTLGGNVNVIVDEGGNLVENISIDTPLENKADSRVVLYIVLAVLFIIVVVSIIIVFILKSKSSSLGNTPASTVSNI